MHTCIQSVFKFLSTQQSVMNIDTTNHLASDNLEGN